MNKQIIKFVYVCILCISFAVILGLLIEYFT